MGVQGSSFCLLGECDQDVVELAQVAAPPFPKLDESLIEKYARLDG